MNRIIEFPEKEEYPTYVEMYMKWVKKDGTLLHQLQRSLETASKLVGSLSSAELAYKYEVGKWSIKEVLVHLVDDERIYAYRALAFARNDKTELPGFEERDYTDFADTSDRAIENIMEEYEAVRYATIALFNGFSDRALIRIGTANGSQASVRALGYHILGHDLHHFEIIKNVYLKKYNKL